MKRPTFSIVHATARPEGWQKAYNTWTQYAAGVDFEYLLVADAGGPLAHLDILGPRVIWNDKRQCTVDAWNAGCAEANGDILILAADDMFPPMHWDQKLLATVTDRTRPFVIETRSGTPADDRRLMVLGILSRALYEERGYALYPEYEGMFSDDDFSEHARQQGIVIDARHLTFQHRHPIFDKSVPNDATYQRANAPEKYARGEMILKRRRATRFGHLTASHTETPEAASSKTKIAVAMPGETFHASYLMNLLGLLKDLAALGYDVLPPFNCYSSDPSVTRETLRQSLLASTPKPDYVLWFDDDNLLTARDFQKLMLDLETFQNLDAIFAWAWIIGTPERPPFVSAGRIKQTSDGTPICEPFTPGEIVKHARAGNLMQLGYSGFPGCLMRYELLERLGTFPFAPLVGEGYKYGKSGEDFAFCVRAAERERTLALDPQVKLPHLKMGPYEPDIRQVEMMDPPNETETTPQANAAD